jgi:hypothetical protein
LQTEKTKNIKNKITPTSYLFFMAVEEHTGLGKNGSGSEVNTSSPSLSSAGTLISTMVSASSSKRNQHLEELKSETEDWNKIAKEIQDIVHVLSDLKSKQLRLSDEKQQIMKEKEKLEMELKLSTLLRFLSNQFLEIDKEMENGEFLKAVRILSQVKKGLLIPSSTKHSSSFPPYAAALVGLPSSFLPPLSFFSIFLLLSLFCLFQEELTKRETKLRAGLSEQMLAFDAAAAKPKEDGTPLLLLLPLVLLLLPLPPPPLLLLPSHSPPSRESQRGVESSFRVPITSHTRSSYDYSSCRFQCSPFFFLLSSSTSNIYNRFPSS